MPERRLSKRARAIRLSCYRKRLEGEILENCTANIACRSPEVQWRPFGVPSHKAIPLTAPITVEEGKVLGAGGSQHASDSEHSEIEDTPLSHSPFADDSLAVI